MRRDRHTRIHTDIATTRLNRHQGQFSEYPERSESSQVGLAEISRLAETQRPAVSMIGSSLASTSNLCLSLPVRSNTRILLDGLNKKYFLKDDAPANYMGRWTSLCIAMDFVTDTTVYYTGGKEFQGSSGRPLRKLSSFLSNRTDLPMVVRLGHYYFDNKPMIGKMVDIHMWSRLALVYAGFIFCSHKWNM